MANLIDKWIAMQAVQGIDSVATLRDGDLVIRMSAVEHVLENLPEVPDINVGSMDTITHDSIPVETGKNDGDRTSGDCISRQAVKDIFTELYGISAIGSVFDKYEWADICETTANEIPSAQPDIIYCKDCKFYTAYDYTGKLMCKRIGKGMILPKPEDYCSYAERITHGKPD